jgi:hypothetical protein
MDEYTMRLILVSLFGLMILGCVASNRAITPGEAMALKAAEEWLDSQGTDLKTVELKAEPDGAGWSVLVEYQPSTPGAHTLLRMDSKGNVIEVVPGA